MKATGLDLSITATGMAIGPLLGDTMLVKTKTKDGDLRLNEIAGRVRVAANGSDLVLIEGLGFGSKSVAVSGMVHGAVRAELNEQGLRYGLVPPNTLKIYATGSGAADKTAMALAAFKRGGIEFRDDNQCDAWWLWLMAMDHLGAPIIQLPETHRRALAKIEMRTV